MNGTAGNDSLANLATLNGTGTVGTVTLARNNILSSGGTLTTERDHGQRHRQLDLERHGLG